MDKQGWKGWKRRAHLTNRIVTNYCCFSYCPLLSFYTVHLRCACGLKRGKCQCWLIYIILSGSELYIYNFVRMKFIDRCAKKERGKMKFFFFFFSFFNLQTSIVTLLELVELSLNTVGGLNTLLNYHRF